MALSKSTLAKASGDIIALVNPDGDEDFDPDKTIYNMRTKNIKSGTILIVVEECPSSLSSLVLVDKELCWVQSSLLNIKPTI